MVPSHISTITCIIQTQYMFYWFVLVVQDPKTRYPIVVRFNKVNYVNVSINNYASVVFQ